MNIVEIAQLAGVSSAAVSRYFNNGYISEQKKEAIRRVVEETGYTPSVTAQTLRTKKTMMIGVIAPRMASFSMGSVVDGILATLRKSGYQMMLAVTQNDPEKELEYLKAFNNRQVDGVILIATVFTPRHLEMLKEMKVPVLINGQKLRGYCSVYYDDYHAMYDMTRYMLDKGRRHLGYIGVMTEDTAAGLERLRGFTDAVKDGRALYPDLVYNILTGTFSVESGEEKAGQMLEKDPQLDGLICATDMIAAGAVRTLSTMGIDVPGQVLVSGQGDSRMAKVVGHRVITIHYSYEKSGEMSAAMLLQMIEKGDQSLNDIQLGYYLVDPGEN